MRGGIGRKTEHTAPQGAVGVTRTGGERADGGVDTRRAAGDVACPHSEGVARRPGATGGDKQLNVRIPNLHLPRC